MCRRRPIVRSASRPPFSAAAARWLPPLGHSEAWTSYATRIAPAGKPLPSGWTQLRFDLPLPADRVLQLRNVRLRAERPGEFDAITVKASASATQEALRSYLDRSFPSVITDVSVSKDFVRIKGTVAPPHSGVFLADIPMDVLLDDPRSWQSLVAVTPDSKGAFLIEVPRHRQRDGRDYDRLTSRWQLVRQSGGEYEPLSHAPLPAMSNPAHPPCPPCGPLTKRAWVAGISHAFRMNSKSLASPRSR